MKCFRFTMVFAVVVYVLFFYNIDVNAASKTSDKQSNFVFYVPDGGISSASIYVNYTEYYSRNGSYSTYNKREIYYAYKMSGATEKPTFVFGDNIYARHVSKSGGILKRFDDWKRINSIVDGKWDTGACYKNEYRNNYATSSKCKGKVTYSVECAGATSRTKTDTITVNLY